jgi:ADP-ribose pyrophosphatase YjhB (NUDIX family)
MAKQLIDYYAGHSRIYVATDTIVFGFENAEIKLLVSKRRMAPEKGKWSLIGSFVMIGEDVDDAAQRVLTEITGLKNVFFEQSRTYGKADRDSGYRCISIAQYALIRLGEYDKELVKKHGAFWYRLQDLPDLVFDHNQMVEDALELLRRKARYQPIGFELLPEKFTIPQLQSLYEAIYQRELDPRNFRKKLLSLNVLKRLDEKDKSNSKKGAFLYMFEHERYRQLLKSGYDFEL